MIDIEKNTTEFQFKNNIYPLVSLTAPYLLPLYSSRIQAGFPSPADDYIDTRLNLNDYLIKNAASSFFVRVSSQSMQGCRIQEGDILIVDRSLKVKHNKIVIAVLGDELAIKRYIVRGGRVFLSSESPHSQIIEIKENSQAYIWGVVTCVIHRLN